MNRKSIISIVGVAIFGVALFLAGTAFGQSRWVGGEVASAPESDKTVGSENVENPVDDNANGSRESMMDSGDTTMDGSDTTMMNDDDTGMMNDDDTGMMNDDDTGMMNDDDTGIVGAGYGGMMDGGYGTMMAGSYNMGLAMMGGWGGLLKLAPMSVEDAQQAVADFLQEQGDDNLAVGEVMIFENHAYAQVLDADSGAGAFEVLVDPQTGTVYPEPGPNMMWNTSSGYMNGGMMGMMGMMGGQYGDRYGSMMDGTFDRDEAEVTVDEVEAVALAQAYLDEFLPGAATDDHADAFPGYYTLHVLRDGEVVGMVSVNAYSGDVFPHTWHDDFVEMAEGHAE